jgi:hypothetical protein
MALSFDLREETEALKDISAYEFPNEQDILSMNAGQVNDLVERQSLLDAIAWILSHSSSIQGPSTPSLNLLKTLPSQKRSTSSEVS